MSAERFLRITSAFPYVAFLQNYVLKKYKDTRKRYVLSHHVKALQHFGAVPAKDTWLVDVIRVMQSRLLDEERRVESHLNEKGRRLYQILTAFETVEQFYDRYKFANEDVRHHILNDLHEDKDWWLLHPMPGDDYVALKGVWVEDDITKNAALEVDLAQTHRVKHQFDAQGAGVGVGVVALHDAGVSLTKVGGVSRTNIVVGRSRDETSLGFGNKSNTSAASTLTGGSGGGRNNSGRFTTTANFLALQQAGWKQHFFLRKTPTFALPTPATTAAHDSRNIRGNIFHKGLFVGNTTGSHAGHRPSKLIVSTSDTKLDTAAKRDVKMSGERGIFPSIRRRFTNSNFIPFGK